MQVFFTKKMLKKLYKKSCQFSPFSPTTNINIENQQKKMKFYKSCILLLSLILGLASANVIPDVKPALKGVTILNDPFVVKKDGVYSGYAIDLMNLIAKEANFTFTLTESPDGRYGMVLDNGTINGMLGEVNQKKADFAIADITVTARRTEFVDFSEPIMESTLGAILKTELVPAGATTMKDLLNVPASNLTLVSLQNGATAESLKLGNSSLAQAFWARLQESAASSPVKNFQEGVIRVTATSGTPTAYIGQTSSLVYFAKRSCQPDLTVLADDAHLGDNQYAVAVQKGSAYLAPINEAIKALKAKGKLAELKDKYWVCPCCSLAIVVE